MDSVGACPTLVDFRGGNQGDGKPFPLHHLRLSTGTDEVDSVLAQAVAAGANHVKPAAQAFWGGYSGYFPDPDGFLWEVAWNPSFSIQPDGSIRLPG